MKGYVIDAGFLSLRFIGDGRVKPYFDEAAQGKAQAYISDVNLAEYYYSIKARKPLTLVS